MIRMTADDKEQEEKTTSTEKICQYSTCGKKATWFCKVNNYIETYELCAIHKDKFMDTFDDNKITVRAID